MRRSALILAGGKSSRMGVEKATLPFGNQTFFHRIFDACERTCSEVGVAVGTDHWEEVYSRLPFRFGHVGDAGEGPLVAIATHLETFQSVFVTACDTPLLQPALIDLLFRRAEGHRGAVPIVAGVPQGTCAVYTGGLADEVEALVESGERRASALARLPGVIPVNEDELRKVDPDLRSFRGCNTIEEYIELLEFAGHPVPYEFLEAAGVRVPGQS